MLYFLTRKRESTNGEQEARPEQAVAKLRQIDVLLGEGRSIIQACKEAGITDVTYYRWRKEYGGAQG
jgi:putative transposase